LKGTDINPMASLLLDIKPCRGLNSLLFGTSTHDAEGCFGKPEETETLGEDAEGSSLVWHFWEKGFSLFFDQHQGNKFTCVEIDHPDSLLWGKKIFDFTEPELKVLFTLKGFKEIDTEDHAWGERRISFDEALMDFYFEKGKMISINYGITLGDDKILILPN
jgi:hypothetical protein